MLLTRKLVFWSRESERADGLRVPYNGEQVALFFAGPTYGYTSSVVYLSRLLFPFPHHLGCQLSSPFPTGLASIFVACVSHDRDLQIECTSPWSRLPLVHFRAVIDPETYHWHSQASEDGSF